MFDRDKWFVTVAFHQSWIFFFCKKSTNISWVLQERENYWCKVCMQDDPPGPAWGCQCSRVVNLDLCDVHFPQSTTPSWYRAQFLKWFAFQISWWAAKITCRNMFSFTSGQMNIAAMWHWHLCISDRAVQNLKKCKKFATKNCLLCSVTGRILQLLHVYIMLA